MSENVSETSASESVGSTDKDLRHENFKRLASNRTNLVIEALRKLSNLSSPNYVFEAEEVDTIFDHISQKVAEARAAFNRGKKTKFSL